MAFRSYRRLSSKAVWSRKVTFICLQLLILTLILHRFASLHTPAAIALIGLVVIGAVLSLILALWALKQIWDRGFEGAGRALLSMAMATVILAGPAWYLPKYFTLPAISDVTTDFNAPPNFEVLAQSRSIWANSVIYPGDDYSEKQKEAYPHIQPMVLERSAEEAFDLVQDAVRRLDWEIVAKQAPGKDGTSGWIEATHKTMIMGFVDDVVVRVSGDDAGARIDVRSASRYGRHDFGKNAQRIDGLFAEVRTSLAKGEQQLKLEKEKQAARALKLKQAEKLRIEKAEQARREKEAELARQRQIAEEQRAKEQPVESKKEEEEKRRSRWERNQLREKEWERLFNPL